MDSRTSAHIPKGGHLSNSPLHHYIHYNHLLTSEPDHYCHSVIALSFSSSCSLLSAPIHPSLPPALLLFSPPLLHCLCLSLLHTPPPSPHSLSPLSWSCNNGMMRQCFNVVVLVGWITGSGGLVSNPHYYEPA